MKYNVTFSEIVSQLANVFASESKTKDYNATNPLYDGVCGWCGVMAPLSRPAYVEAFGEILTARAEKEARQIVADKAQTFANSEYMKHAHEADALQGVPTVGGFFWAYNSGVKCDSGEGLAQELHALTCYTTAEELATNGARLCKVCEVLTVSAEDFDRPELADELTAKHQPKGGSASDDIDEGANWYDLTDEERATLYTFGAIVTDGVRFFLIDSEGYSYARYIYVPTSWRTMYATEVAEIERKENERKAAEAKAEAEAKAQRRADYESKCKKWAHLMEDVRPLEAKESEAWAAVVAAHYRKGAETKAHTATKRATDNARKRNILAMCRAAFPGVKFSCSVRRGWGADFELTWTDGPTVEEFNAQTDLDIFCSSYDTFDGMTDCADRESKEFTDFSAITMGSNGGNVDASRDMSEEVKAAIIAEIVAAVPEYDERNSYGHYQVIEIAPEKAQQVGEAVGVAASALYRDHWHGIDYRLSLDVLARRVWDCRSYTPQTAPTTPTEPTAPTKGGKAQDVTTEGAQAPEGLELIETAEGVAVVGNSRTTYRHRKEIKARGAKWNKTAQRWEAVDAEGVESLRQWFGVSASEQTAPTAESATALQRVQDITDTANDLEELRQLEEENARRERENEALRQARKEKEQAEAEATQGATATADTANESAALHDAKEITPDQFEGVPDSVRNIINEIKAKGTEGADGAKRAELLALLAEQWQEKPEYIRKALAYQIESARPEETAEALACEVVAIVAAHQHDNGAPANYIKACELRDWFNAHKPHKSPLL